MSDDIPDDPLNQAMDDHEAKQTKGQAEVVVAQPYFSPSELAESKWPDVWRKKVPVKRPKQRGSVGLYCCCAPKCQNTRSQFSATQEQMRLSPTMCGGLC